jgi:hypothetical protein
MLRPVKKPGERRRGDRRRVVARLEQVGQALLSETLEILCRKCRPQRDVRHDRKRVVEPRDRHVHADGGCIEGACGRQAGAQALEHVGDFQRGLSGRAFIEHGRREACHAELAGGIGRAARQDDEVDLRERHLMGLDHQHAQPVRERPLLHRRKIQRRRRTDCRRTNLVVRDHRGHEEG